MKTVNERIAKYRRLANLTQTDMAEKLGIKCSTYSQMERKGIVSAERLFQMADIFGVTVCELYDGVEPCKKNIGISLQANDPSSLIFRQPPMPKIEKEIFTVTKKEENLIKIIRNLSKSNYDKTMRFIEEIYKEEKK